MAYKLRDITCDNCGISKPRYRLLLVYSETADIERLCVRCHDRRISITIEPNPTYLP